MKERNSIQTKLVLIMLLVAAFAVVFAMGLMLFDQVRAFRKMAVESDTTLTSLIADYSVADLAFGDKAASQSTLSKLTSFSSVEAVYVYDRDGNPFSSYSKDPRRLNSFPRPRGSSVKFQGDSLIVFRPVIYSNEHYGTVCLVASLAPLNRQVRTSTVTAVALTLLLILLSYLLATQLQRVISRPIRELTNAARRISTQDDYSLRVTKTSQDEIGVLCDGFNTMLEQIEQRRRRQQDIEQELRESEERHRRLVESSPEIILVEQDGRIVYGNPAGIALLGYQADELGRQGVIELIAEDGREAMARRLERLDEQPALLETAFVNRAGKRIEAELVAISTSFHAKPALQIIARDITERKRLREAADRMQRLAALGELSATLAHEIRNSLSSITLNFRALSERAQSNEKQQQILKNMEFGIARIQNLMRGILDFARPAPPLLKRVDIHRVIDSSIRLVEREFEEAGIRITRNYTAGQTDVLVDSNQMSQVFLNLFLNARQAMKTGGILTVATSCAQSCIEVQVSDTGKGILPENVGRIFNPFFTTNPDGIGLGLAIVSRILEQHRAEILVETKPGSGSTFTIRFRRPT